MSHMEPAAPCEDSAMKAFVAPVALASVLALSACGEDEQTDSSVERGAASSDEKSTLCGARARPGAATRER